MAGWSEHLRTQWIPLFPLPGCVLFPGVGMPLHIFETRYRLMIHDLTNRPEIDRWIALALLKDHYEHLYGTSKAPIYSVVCLARLVHCHRLSDGRYNIFVLGVARVTVLGENREQQYRRVRLTPLAPASAPGTLAEDAAGRLQSLLRRAVARGWMDRELINRLGLVLPEHEQWIDMLAHHLMPPADSALKQRILEEPHLDVRAEILTRWLESGIERFEREEKRPSWPPRHSLN